PVALPRPAGRGAYAPILEIQIREHGALGRVLRGAVASNRPQPTISTRVVAATDFAASFVPGKDFRTMEGWPSQAEGSGARLYSPSPRRSAHNCKGMSLARPVCLARSRHTRSSNP